MAKPKEIYLINAVTTARMRISSPLTTVLAASAQVLPKLLPLAKTTVPPRDVTSIGLTRSRSNLIC